MNESHFGLGVISSKLLSAVLSNSFFVIKCPGFSLWSLTFRFCCRSLLTKLCKLSTSSWLSYPCVLCLGKKTGHIKYKFVHFSWENIFDSSHFIFCLNLSAEMNLLSSKWMWKNSDIFYIYVINMVAKSSHEAHDT